MEGVHPLKAFRDDHNPPLTQTELAGLLEVSCPTIWRWEARKRLVGKKQLPKVAERTGIHPADLRPDLADLFKESEPIPEPEQAAS